MSHRIGINIEKTGSQSYWDFEVYTEIDYADTLTGFIKQHDNDVEFVVDKNQAIYHEDDMDEMLNFVQSGRW